MKIILANFYMQAWTGSELFVRDLAVALHERGHSVIVFAQVLGALADEMSKRCIACIDDLNQMADVPDIVIGNSRDETVMCLARFPRVPVISVCHDRTAYQGMPPLFTRIRQYVAVDENCIERLSQQHGIHRSRIKLIHNGVDLARFQRRAPLPEKPSRALFFSNCPKESDPGTLAVASACTSMGITLDLAGAAANREQRSPETLLPQYDLVFAKARCAMEAMAVGCAVIVLNEGAGIDRMAGMVTPSNIEHWRRWNFGRKLLQTPTSREAVMNAIANYDRDDARQCSDWVRENLSLDTMTTAFEQLAKKTVDEHARQPDIPPDLEWREFADHYTKHLQIANAHQTDAQLKEERETTKSLQETLSMLQLHGTQLSLRLDESERRIQPLSEEVTSLRHTVEDLRQQLTQAAQFRSALLNSLSWRLTRPLRQLGQLLGKPKSNT